MSLARVRDARADPEETERRLKAAGVSPELRRRVHDAIDRGVVWIASRQRKDGGWRGGPVAEYAGLYATATPALDSGYTALAALALRHAGTAVSRPAAERATIALLPREQDVPPPGIADDVYTAGIVTMLLRPDPDARRRAVAKEIARGIEGGLWIPDGLWGYSTLGRESPRSGRHNLSTSQFACIGMFEGQRLGLPVQQNAWRVHLARLARMCKSAGGFCYEDRTALDALRIPYWTATFMAHADLTLGWESMRGHWLSGEPLRETLDELRVTADGLLRRDAGRLLADLENQDPGLGAGGDPLKNRWSYYALYSLEKACVFADVASIGDVNWYVRGAEHLLRLQSRDGGWGWPPREPAQAKQAGPGERESTLDDTALALLFLLRVSESYRPTDPRPIDTPPVPALTPKDPAPATPK